MQDYKELSTSEKVLLVEEIWDSIADDKLSLTKEQQQLLDERLQSYHSSAKRTTWDAIKKNVRAKKAK